MFALALASVELTSSYRFYQVNAYKIALATLCVTVLAPLALWAGLRRRLPAPPFWLLALWTLPVLVTLPGLLLTQGKWSHDTPEQLTQAVVVIAWAWLAWALAQAGHAMRLLALMFYLGGACALLALAETLRLGHLTPGVFRARASFGNPGYLAGFLLLLLPLGLARVYCLPARHPTTSPREFVGHWARWGLDAVLTAAIIAALLVNKTRVAQLLTLLMTAGAMIVCLHRYLQHLTLPVWAKNQRHLLFALLAVATLCISGALLAHFDIWARFQGMSNTSDLQGRLVPWEAAIKAFLDNPWLGYGPGSYYSVFFSYVDAESRAFWGERSYFDPHNGLLSMAVEGGALGVVTGIGIWLAWARLLWQLQRSTGVSRSQRYQIVAVLVGLLTLLAFSLTAVSYRMMSLMLPTHVLLAATLGLARPASPDDGARWLMLPALIGIAWLAGFNMLTGKYHMVATASLPPATRYAALQSLSTKTPSIYLLQRLLQESLIRGDWSQFFKTARQMERRLPHYRTTGHVVAQGYMRRGDWRNARIAALKFQQRDRYFADNNKLLIRLAIFMRDEHLLRAQLKHAIRFSLYRQGALPSRQTRLELHTGISLMLDHLTTSPDTVTVSIPEDTMARLTHALKTYYRQGDLHKKLETGNIFRFFLAPLTEQVRQVTDKDQFVEDMLLQLI